MKEQVLVNELALVKEQLRVKQQVLVKQVLVKESALVKHFPRYETRNGSSCREQALVHDLRF